MPAQQPADIYSMLFIPMRFGMLAQAMGVKETTFGDWVRGRRTMPADKRRQFALLIDKRLTAINDVVGRLIYEADSMKPRQHRRIAGAWHTPSRGPNIKEPLTPASL